MPRLSRQNVAERESFTIKNFEAGMTIEQAQVALVAKDTHKMNPYRIKELFDQVRDKVETAKERPPETAGGPCPYCPEDGGHERMVDEARCVYCAADLSAKTSLRDLPTPVLNPNGDYKTIPEIIKDIEAGKYPKE